MKILSVILAVVIAAAAGGYWLAVRSHHAPPRPTLPTMAAPPATATPFALHDVDGTVHHMEDWKGKVIVLNFWATYCPPCREEIPVFSAVQKQYRGDGLQIIGVAIDKAQQVKDFRNTLRVNYPLLIGGHEGLQLLSKYGDVAGLLPYSVVIDRNGRVRATKLGAYTRAELERAVKPLLTGAHAG